jgi:hypothetical protein
MDHASVCVCRVVTVVERKSDGEEFVMKEIPLKGLSDAEREVV